MISGIGSYGLLVLGGILVIVLLIVCVVIIKNKKKFVYPVRIFRTRENNKVVEVNYKGGYIGRKNSSPFFRIKTGFWWWKYIDLLTTPDLRYMDEQNRVYYRQDDVDTFQQVKRFFDVDTNVHFQPVEADTKYGAILSIQRIRQLTGGSDKWKTIAAIGGMVLIFSLAIVGWALMMNAKCPTVG